MKQIIVFIWSFLLLLCLGACQREAASNEDVAVDEGITLELLTRANENVEYGDDRFNENVIVKADVFFFNDEEGACVYSQTGIVPSGNKIKVKLDGFTEGDYYVYVIANGNFSYVNNGVGSTLDGLKSLVATTEWGNQETRPETSLLMDGGNTFRVQKNGSGSVALTRAMAKVTLSVAAQVITENGVKYEPQLSGMYVSMVNIVKSTNLKGDYAVNSSTDYMKMDKRIIRKFQEDENGSYYHVPFYSYPNPENTADREDAYLILRLPWKRVVDGSGNYDAIDYYYQVPITGSNALALCTRNHYYKLNLKVGVLGSLNPQTPVSIEPSFVIEDWFTEELTADMQNYRYLSLDEYNSVMNNVDELRMPYVSSSKITEAKVTQVEYTDYSSVQSRQVTVTNSRDLVDYSVEVDGDELVFQHVLSENDFMPFTITVEVTNEQGISQEWTITQYPAIYIEGHKAEYKLYVAGKYNNSSRDYVSVTYGGYDLGSVQNPSTVNGNGTNNNYNNYTIYVTSFDLNDNYQIGDPRTLDDNNLKMEGLTSYFPSRNDDDAWWVIAPAFKIASSRGKTLGITFDNAQRRCAAYQEDGYGAGRWRVPTRAEIEFIVNLSANGKIPTLFDGEYWCADGAYYSSSDKEFHDNGGEQAVRCVYDIWYWGEERAENPDVFDWRDKPLN